MKKQYRSPSVKMVDYKYDDQVVATSPGGSWGNEGSGYIGSPYCQQGSLACIHFYIVAEAFPPCVSDPIT